MCWKRCVQMFKRKNEIAEAINNLAESIRELPIILRREEFENFKKEIQDQLDKIETKKVKKDGKLK